MLAEATVTLTAEEMHMGALIGASRRIESMLNGRTSGAHTHDELNAWDIDIEGACAEIAVAKCIGRYWSGSVGSFKEPDIGQDVQVRWTHLVTGRLIVRDDDPDEHRYVLVVGTAPRYRVVGWMRGSEAKNPLFAKDPNGRPSAFFVPQSCLHPIALK